MKIAYCIQMLFVLPIAYGQTNDVLYVSSDTLGVEQNSQTSIDDTLVLKFFSSVFSLEQKRDNFKDSLRSGVFESKWIDHRQSMISLGYEYGLLRGYIDPEATNPLQVFNIRGDVSIAAKNIPLLVSFNYSTWQNPLGVNNFFRITLDQSRFSNLNTDLRNQGKSFYDDQIKQVQNNKTDVLKKMNYGEVLMQKYKREMDQRKKEMLNYERELKKLEMQEKANAGLGNEADSLDIQNKKDSLNKKHQEAQALANKAMTVYDSIQSVYQKAQEILGYYNGLQSDLNTQKDQYLDKFNNGRDNYSLENGQNALGAKKKGLGIENIRNFELGLSYPQLSGLGTGGVPIQGINIEIEKNNWYYAVCAGIMQNNLMMTTDATYNKFFNTQNLMNQFDFRNIRERGLITQVRFGRGTKEATHAHIAVSYLSNALSSQFNNQNQEVNVPSLGLELDLRFVPKNHDNLAFDLIYGKSSRYESVGEGSSVFASAFSSDRTHAALFRMTQRIEKIKTQIITSARWIDPFADTRSYGVVQPNHFRVETRTIHNVSKSFRFGFNYRQDMGNIALPSDSTTQLYVGGFFVDAVVGEHFTLFGSANYVNFNQRSSQANMNQVNYMLNGGIATSYKLFDTEHNIIVNYGDNLITDTSTTGTFRTLNIQKSTKLRKGSNSFILGYFYINDPALLQATSYVVGDEISWNFKKLKITGGVKMAYNEDLDWNWGGKLEVNYKVAKYAELFFGAEKLILGDFFNNYNRTLYDTFPFAFTTRINFLLK
jgi:hypothetical protein